MTTPISSNCALRLVDLINSIDSGIQPYPIFYHYNNCTEQWPPIEDSDVLARSKVFGYNTGTDLCPDKSVGKCRTPFISSIIAPQNVKIQFWAKTSDTINRFVQNQGYYELNSEVLLKPKELVPKPTVLSSSTSMWAVQHTIVGWKGAQNRYNATSIYATDTNEITTHWNRLPTAITDDCSYPEVGQTTNHAGIDSTVDFCPQGCKSFSPATQNDTNNNTPYDWNNLWAGNLITGGFSAVMKGSLVSCGSVFWPSFIATESDAAVLTDTIKSGKNWASPSDYCRIDANDNYTLSGYAGVSLNQSTFGKGVPTDDKVLFNTRECIDRCPLNGAPYNCAVGEDGVDYRVNGSVGQLHITQTQPWLLTQIQACTGVQPLKIANNLVKSYGDGTDLCDPIMERACASSIVQTDPDLSVSCECIVEKQKLQQQFAGLDLPVECFLDICNKEGTGIYHTKQQKQGCNARICEQIFRVHGYDIIANGQQTLKCSGEVYNVSNFVNKVNTTATVNLPTPALPKAKLHFTPLFFGALGLMVLMGLLLIVWIIRRSVIYKRAKSQKKKQLESILSQDLKNIK